MAMNGTAVTMEGCRVGWAGRAGGGGPGRLLCERLPPRISQPPSRADGCILLGRARGPGGAGWAGLGGQGGGGAGPGPGSSVMAMNGTVVTMEGCRVGRAGRAGAGPPTPLVGWAGSGCAVPGGWLHVTPGGPSFTVSVYSL